MAKQLQLRKGTATEHNTFTGANGEVTVDTTNKTLRVHDGSTVGGIRLATVTGGLVPSTQLPDATTSVKGAVVLNNTLTSTSTAQALTAAQGKVLNDQAFGVGQTWQNLTSSRASGVTYTNSTGKPIHIFIAVRDGVDGGLRLVIGGVTIFNFTYDLPAWVFYPVSVIIPNDTDYSFTWAGNSPSDLLTWSELR